MIESIAEVASGDVPLGLIRSSWGGTNIAEWLPAANIPDCNHPHHESKRHQHRHQQLEVEVETAVKVEDAEEKDEERKRWHAQQRSSNRSQRSLLAATSPPSHQLRPSTPPPPSIPSAPTLLLPSSALETSSLFNGMIAPFKTIGFAFVVWYQGESNVG